MRIAKQQLEQIVTLATIKINVREWDSIYCIWQAPYSKIIRKVAIRGNAGQQSSVYQKQWATVHPSELFKGSYCRIICLLY